jgi:GNAT superfamily N-acetyltransferase
MLLKAVEDWARNQQMNTLVGPFGFSDKDPQGMQVEGREFLPVIAAPSHPGYLVAHLVNLGFQPHTDCLSYGLPVQAVPDAVSLIAERARTTSGAHLVQFRSRRELKPWIVPVLRLVNEAYAGLFGFMPMEEHEMQVLARQYLPVLDPEFTLVLTDKSGAVVAFGIAMPNITPGIRKARGHVFPLGIIHLMLASRKSRQLDLLLGAVRSDWRNRGLTAWLGEAMLQSAMKRKFEWIDSHLILEKNRLMRGVMEKFGGTVYKRYRIFYRPINESTLN